MERYYTPDEFRELKRIALDLGFGHVESGPLVRSSYHAHEQAESYARGSEKAWGSSGFPGVPEGFLGAPLRAGVLASCGEPLNRWEPDGTPGNP